MNVKKLIYKYLSESLSESVKKEFDISFDIVNKMLNALDNNTLYLDTADKLYKIFRKYGGEIHFDDTDNSSYFTIETKMNLSKIIVVPVIVYNKNDVRSIYTKLKEDSDDKDELLQNLIWYSYYIITHELSHVPVFFLINKYKKQFYNSFVGDFEKIEKESIKYYNHKSLRNKSIQYKVWRSTKECIRNRLLDLEEDYDMDENDFTDFWDMIEDSLIGGIIYLLRRKILHGKSDYDFRLVEKIHELMSNKHDVDYYMSWINIVNELIADMLIMSSSNIFYRMMYERTFPRIYTRVYEIVYKDKSFKDLRNLIR